MPNIPGPESEFSPESELIEKRVDEMVQNLEKGDLTKAVMEDRTLLGINLGRLYFRRERAEVLGKESEESFKRLGGKSVELYESLFRGMSLKEALRQYLDKDPHRDFADCLNIFDHVRRAQIEFEHRKREISEEQPVTSSVEMNFEGYFTPFAKEIEGGVVVKTTTQFDGELRGIMSNWGVSSREEVYQMFVEAKKRALQSAQQLEQEVMGNKKGQK